MIFVPIALLFAAFSGGIVLLALCQAASIQAPLERTAAGTAHIPAATQGNNVGGTPVTADDCIGKHAAGAA